jgi:hypothetical protein
MWQMRSLSLGLLSVLTACNAGPFLSDDMRFACVTSRDCAPGFSCITPPGVCLEESASHDAGVSGDDAGVTDDAGVGPDGGPPGGLAFGTTSQTRYVGACSAPLIVELITSEGDAAVAFEPVPISMSSTGPISFFATADCSGAETSEFEVSPGASSVSIRFVGHDAGMFTLRAFSPGLGLIAQSATFRPMPDGLAITSTAPTSPPAGTCFPMTVTATAGGVPAEVVGSTPVSLSVSPQRAARFYQSSNCASNQTSEVNIRTMTTQVTVYVKALTGGPITLQASTSFGSATQTVNVVPAVRSGQCSFSASGTSGVQTVNCGIVPPVQDAGSAFLIFQATTSASGTQAQNVRCQLSSTSTVECVRQSGGGSSATVAWQVFEAPSGLLVEHVSPPCGTAPSTVPLSRPFVPTQSFVLKSASNAGLNFDDDDMPVAELALDGGALFMAPGTCQTYSVQVVQLTGATVVRGEVDGGLPAGVFSVDAVLPAAGATSSVVLAQPHAAINSPTPLCALLARAALVGTNRVRFSRGAGQATDGPCNTTPISRLFYERIDFGTRGVVQQRTTVLPAGVLTADVSITPVDRSRSIVFASSQVLAGQGSAETDLTTAGASLSTGVALVRFSFVDDSTVRVTRDIATAEGRVTFYVVELVP